MDSMSMGGGPLPKGMKAEDTVNMEDVRPFSPPDPS